jgi:methyl-accepting chemotaxis protein
MVKEASAAVEAVNKSVADIAKAKEDISKESEEIAKSKNSVAEMLKDLTTAMKDIPLRKSAPADKEEDRTQETVTQKSLTETEEFQKLRPDQQLHALITSHIR